MNDEKTIERVARSVSEALLRDLPEGSLIKIDDYYETKVDAERYLLRKGVEVSRVVQLDRLGEYRAVVRLWVILIRENGRTGAEFVFEDVMGTFALEEFQAWLDHSRRVGECLAVVFEQIRAVMEDRREVFYC